ncbi:hypothetical protein ACQ4PT_042833 [Festuca glaucescens]
MVNAGSGATTTFLTDSAEDRDVARRVLGVVSAAVRPPFTARRTPTRPGRHVRCCDTRWWRAWCARAWPTEMVLKSGCRPMLTSLSSEVLDARWDVVVDDGPSVDRPEELVRMGAIYRAAALARVAAKR